MNIYTNQEVLEELKLEASQIFFKSSFEFVNATNGWRPEKIHLFLSTTGGGKSTLVRTILLDMLGNFDKKIGIYLSEETEKEFYTELAFSGYDDIKDFERVKIFSEQELEKSPTAQGTLINMKMLVEENKIDILLVDNITTLDSYESSLQNRTLITKGLKKLAAISNIPIVVIAHTDAKFKQGQIDPNDIRGSKTITLESHFIYALQPVLRSDGQRSFLVVKKDRGQPVKNKHFELFYYSQRRIFGKDEPVDFEVFKEAFNARDKL